MATITLQSRVLWTRTTYDGKAFAMVAIVTDDGDRIGQVEVDITEAIEEIEAYDA